MTKLATRKREIEQLEGITVQIFTPNGQLVNLDTQGLPAYAYTKKAPGTMTVVDWRTGRFERSYPGYTCEVLNKDGTVAHGNTQLKNVR